MVEGHAQFTKTLEAEQSRFTEFETRLLRVVAAVVAAAVAVPTLVIGAGILYLTRGSIKVGFKVSSPNTFPISVGHVLFTSFVHVDRLR